MKRVQVNQWWELEAANGERAVEYDATCEGFGPPSMAARRFDKEDFEPTADMFGRLCPSEIEQLKARKADRGPFKVFRVTRYRLAPCKRRVR